MLVAVVVLWQRGEQSDHFVKLLAVASAVITAIAVFSLAYCEYATAVAFASAVPTFALAALIAKVSERSEGRHDATSRSPGQPLR